MDQRILPSATDCWPFILGKSVDELRQSLLYATLELEYTRNAVKEEVERRDQQTKELLQLLDQACRERDEANDKCNKLHEKLLLVTTTAPPQPPLSPPAKAPVVTTLAETINVLKNADSTTSESDSLSRNSSSTVQSLFDLDFSDDHRHYQTSPPAPPPPEPVPDFWPEIKGKLPEKGKLLQAVINAGPLLHTLLLAGPLPQWRHPPPPLDSFQIPPVNVCASVSGGSSVTDGSFAKMSPEPFSSDDRSKHRRVY